MAQTFKVFYDLFKTTPLVSEFLSAIGASPDEKAHLKNIIKALKEQSILLQKQIEMLSAQNELIKKRLPPIS